MGGVTQLAFAVSEGVPYVAEELRDFANKRRIEVAQGESVRME